MPSRGSSPGLRTAGPASPSSTTTGWWHSRRRPSSTVTADAGPTPPTSGHAAPWDEEGRLRETLYAGLAGDWVRGACPEHVVTVLADDDVAIRTLGPPRLRAVRGGPCPRPVPGGSPRAPGGSHRPARRGVGHRRRRRSSMPACGATSRPRPCSCAPAPHLPPRSSDGASRTRATRRSSPNGTERRSRSSGSGPSPMTWRRSSATPARPASRVRSPFPSLRGWDVASALLDEAVAWAREQGYVRCAADHESANREAARFWARHATPGDHLDAASPRARHGRLSAARVSRSRGPRPAAASRQRPPPDGFPTGSAGRLLVSSTAWRSWA